MVRSEVGLPLRFTVNNFEMKGKLLKASMNLRKSENDIFNNIYFTPDLTKRQREEAFQLREQRRYRMKTLNETNLKIIRGKIVQVQDETESDPDARNRSWSGGHSMGTMILNFWTDRPGLTVQTQMLLQSDLGLHCLPFRLHRLDSLLYCRAT